MLTIYYQNYIIHIERRLSNFEYKAVNHNAWSYDTIAIDRCIARRISIISVKHMRKLYVHNNNTSPRGLACFGLQTCFSHCLSFPNSIASWLNLSTATRMSNAGAGSNSPYHDENHIFFCPHYPGMAYFQLSEHYMYMASASASVPISPSQSVVRQAQIMYSKV